VGKVLMVLSGIALFIVDMLSLYALNLEHGLIWAVVAFFVIPLQIFVPFLVGTWPIALLLTGVFFLGAFLDDKKNKSDF
jgi:hypothetical protein